MNDFSPVLITELIAVIMADGRWWSATALRKRLRVYRGIVTGTLDRLRRMGLVERGFNPLHPGRPFHRVPEAMYLYRWIGEEWAFKHSTLKPGTPAGYLRYLCDKRLPRRWREILK